MAKENLYPALNEKIFQKRVKKTFLPFYLTTSSLIQGVALGLLANEFFPYFKNISKLTTEDIINICSHSFLSFLIIVIVFFCYFLLVIVQRWALKCWDIFIPFSIGITEIAPLYFLKEPKIWWLTNFIFSISIIIAFNYTSTKTNKKKFQKNHIKVKNNLNQAIHNSFIIFIITFIGFLLNQYSFIYTSFKFLNLNVSFNFNYLLYFSFLIIIIRIFYKNQKFLTKLYYDYKIEY